MVFGSIKGFCLSRESVWQNTFCLIDPFKICLVDQTYSINLNWLWNIFALSNVFLQSINDPGIDNKSRLDNFFRSFWTFFSFSSFFIFFVFIFASFSSSTSVTSFSSFISSGLWFLWVCGFLLCGFVWLCGCVLVFRFVSCALVRVLGCGFDEKNEVN